MRGTLFVFTLIAVAGPAAAQTTVPRADVAVSYSILRDFDLDETFPVGWVAAVAGNLTDQLAVVGEVGGNYTSIDVFATSIDLNVHTFLGGVRYASRANADYMPFAQFLAGAARASGGAFGVSASNTGFALQPGGGVDIALNAGTAVRVQADYRAVRDSGDTTSEFRFAAGVVFNLGSR
jgi:hypothetical protein